MCGRVVRQAGSKFFGRTFFVLYSRH